MEMTLEPVDTFYGDELQPDLTRLPGWEQADPETRSKIVQSAKKYVLEQDPQTDEWIGTNICIVQPLQAIGPCYFCCKKSQVFSLKYRLMSGRDGRQSF